MTQDYKKALRQEEKFWSEKRLQDVKDGFVPDLRVDYRLKNVENIWDDSRLEKSIRGKYRDKIIELAKNNGGKVLELGCGSGALSLELARYGLDVTGIDVSSASVSIARDYLGKISKDNGFGKLTYLCDDLNHLKLENNIFDTVIAWDSLHHILLLENLFNQVDLALKDKGAVIIFDHIGQHGIKKIINKLLILAFYLILPMRINFIKKISLLLKKLVKKAESPFEDVSTTQIEELSSKKFKIVSKEKVFSFSIPLLGRIKKNSFLRDLLLAIDKALINLRILDGEYIFLVAKKIY